jgi:hypothetical protein
VTAPENGYGRAVARHVLVVTPSELDGRAVEERVRTHAGADAELLVVVPSTKVSRLQWLTNEEDDARAEADSAAAAAERQTGERTAAVASHEADPVQAVEDALRTFPADEIVVVTKPDAEAEWLEGGAAAEALRRFDLPLTHLVLDERDPAPHEAGVESVRPYAESHEVARGEAEHTPASLLGRVAALVWGVAGLIAVILVVVWLLVR